MIHHAKKFVDYLNDVNQSSRNIQKFYEHYSQANKDVRQNMADMPEAFFKSLTASKFDISKEKLWKIKLEKITKELITIQKIFTEIFYRDECQVANLVEPFNKMRCSVDCLSKLIEDFIHDKTGDKKAS